MINHTIVKKEVAAILSFIFVLTLAVPGWSAMTYGREKLKGDSATQGDYSQESRCPRNQTACGKACVNVQTDTRNCGACGTVCAKGSACNKGVCEATGAVVPKGKTTRPRSDLK